MNPKTITQIRPVGAPPENQSWATAWKTHPFLRDLKSGLLTPLAACAMPTEFKAEELIFREGEMANRFYLIVEGRVQLEAEATDRPGVLVDYIGTGDVLGWSWLFPPYTWNFTARAVEPVRAIFFYGTWLREQCDADPALGYELMKRTTAWSFAGYTPPDSSWYFWRRGPFPAESVTQRRAEELPVRRFAFRVRPETPPHTRGGRRRRACRHA